MLGDVGIPPVPSGLGGGKGAGPIAVRAQVNTISRRAIFMISSICLVSSEEVVRAVTVPPSLAHSSENYMRKKSTRCLKSSTGSESRKPARTDKNDVSLNGSLRIQNKHLYYVFSVKRFMPQQESNSTTSRPVLAREYGTRTHILLY